MIRSTVTFLLLLTLASCATPHDGYCRDATLPELGDRTPWMVCVDIQDECRRLRGYRPVTGSAIHDWFRTDWHCSAPQTLLQEKA